MSHSNAKITVHAVWATYKRLPYIKGKLENLLFKSVKEILEKEECVLIAINGVEDHLHILFMLNNSISLSVLMNKIKGVSAKIINESKVTNDHFKWQIGYHAGSVSKDRIPIVKRYIDKQKIHHKTTTYKQELETYFQY